MMLQHPPPYIHFTDGVPHACISFIKQIHLNKSYLMFLPCFTIFPYFPCVPFCYHGKSLLVSNTNSPPLTPVTTKLPHDFTQPLSTTFLLNLYFIFIKEIFLSSICTCFKEGRKKLDKKQHKTLIFALKYLLVSTGIRVKNRDG